MMHKMGKNDVFIRYYNVFISFIWIVLYLTLLALASASEPFKEAFINSTIFIVLSFIVVTFISKVLLPRALKRQKMSLFAVQVLAAMLVLTILIVIFVEDFNKPTYIDVEYSMLYGFVASLPSAVLIIAAFCGFEFYKQLTLQQRTHLEEQLQFLKSQVNPHLMFNVFNHLHILMEKNTELASDLLVQFSDVLRYQLYECNHDRMFLEQELKYLNDVIAIEQVRWGDELKVETTFDIQDGRKQIAPLILITFVENAFKHVSRLPSKIGYVNICLKQEGHILNMEVENSRTEQQVRTATSGLGLNNTKKRLSIVYPKEHDLSFHITDSVYKVNLRINLE